MSIVNNNLSILLFLAILPVILILIYVYYQDKNKEPTFLLVRLFIGGMLSCGLVLLVSNLLEKISPLFATGGDKSFLEVLFYAFISVALIEELCKWIMVYIFGYHTKEFDEVYDGLIYAVFVSLGFAFIENILYVVISNSIYTAFVRALCAVPSHACDAIFMGYHMSIAKEYKIKGNKKREFQHLILSIIMPTIVHGIYDFCLLSGYKVFIYAFLVFMIFMYITSMNKLKGMSLTRNKITEAKHRFCKYCGAIINQSIICPRCGKSQENHTNINREIEIL